MKNNLFTILKVSLIDNLGINKLKQSSSKKKLLYAVGGIFIVANLLLSLFVYSSALLDFLKKYNLQVMMLPLFAFFTYFLSIYFNMYSAKNRFFEAKDNDLLLSMPIKMRTILTSRLIMLFLINFLITLFIFIPAVITYITKVEVTTSFYPIIILIVIFLPFVPTVIASLIGYIIAFFTSKVNIKNLFEIIFSLILVGMILYLSNNMGTILSKIVTNVDYYEKIIKYISYPIYAINQMLVYNNNESLIFYVIYNIVIGVLFILLLNKSYFKIISSLKKTNTKSKYNMKTLKTNSIRKALLIKEIKRYFSSPIYILNTSFGVIMLLVLAIITIFSKENIIGKVFEFGEDIKLIEMMAILIAGVSIADNPACVSLSLEGNNFWILKSMPVDTKEILNMKILFNVLIVVPITIISIIIMKFSIGYSIIDGLYLICLTVILSIFAGYFGILINLIFPKFEYNSDVEVVKQSMSSVIGILAPLMFIILIGVLYPLIKINTYNFISIIIFIFLIMIVIIRNIINSWGIKRFFQIG